MTISASTDSTAAPAPTMEQLEVVLGAHAERLKQHDLESFDEIYRLTRDEAARVLFHLSGPGADLERQVGDVYVRLFEELRSLPAGAPLRPVLHRLCAKVALQRPALFHRPAPRALDLEGHPAAQAALRIHQALGRLPARVRVVFVLSEVLGLSSQEARAATGLSQSALESSLRRARLTLTEALRSHDEAAETEVTP